MQTFHPGLQSPTEAIAQTLLLGVCTSLLLAVGVSEFSTTRDHHTSATAPVELTGAAHVFATTEQRAEWQTTAPASRPATVFGKAENHAEWATVVPRSFE